LADAEAQDTVTAEMGTVGQLPNPGESACTVMLQFPGFPLRFCQVIEALALPRSTGAKSGLTALNVMVAGLTMRVKSLAPGRANTVGALLRVASGRGAAGCPAAAKNAATDSQITIGS